jgi:3-dehydroquinate dehydratase-2
MAKLLILHGPNLNLLGSREPHLYGTQTLDAINQQLQAEASALGHVLVIKQSNAEHLLIEALHEVEAQGIAFIIINPGALTHTSISLRDALLAVSLPFIEVHISNIFAREGFRRRSYISDIAVGVISGLGPQGYSLALRAAATILQQ